jgi:hypothetical protein
MRQTKRDPIALTMSAFGGKADVARAYSDVVVPQSLLATADEVIE